MSKKMSSPPKREMAISGAHQIFMLQLNKQKIVLFSDKTHKFQECKDDYNFNPIYNIADYLIKLSNKMEGSLYMESSCKNHWNQQEPSHMEDVYVKFLKKRGQKIHKVNNFFVYEIDERFISTDIDSLISTLLQINTLKKLLKIVYEKDFDEYKKCVDFAIDILRHKYSIDGNESCQYILNESLKVNFEDLLQIYTEDKKEMKKEMKKIESGELENLGEENMLYKFLLSFFMFLVDFTFFIHFLKSPTTFHFGFLGSYHVFNIIKIFNRLGYSDVKVLSSVEDCIQVSELHEFLKK
jgi:hypothetical protein